MSTCPCCGSPLASEADIGRTMPLSRLERRIFDRLSRSFGEWVPTPALIQACYWDDATGGPDDGPKAISATLKGLRRKLRDFGMQIDWQAGRGEGDRKLIWQPQNRVSTSINTSPDQITRMSLQAQPG